MTHCFECFALARLVCRCESKTPRFLHFAFAAYDADILSRTTLAAICLHLSLTLYKMAYYARHVSHRSSSSAETFAVHRAEAISAPRVCATCLEQGTWGCWGCMLKSDGKRKYSE
ncbi:hypothetical protein HBI56_169030 [Parastagonospora nodorum]|nr:hypothetical protein HBH53_184470 [Parastagonospora nodorum]KAH3988896.1 hypothetical protein HBH52_024680 [Parastagonospora nodorum]KAH3997434.1 hypothetical protein HBI10_143680 [Parastagonospora nodorum]KAH4021131.1 hypothetical protein HBI13_111980 [Parastagonospora nodorum]KAH4037085.1 hypothetical protein HBI09_065690 [Parastagonospora nodorum]